MKYYLKLKQQQVVYLQKNTISTNLINVTKLLKENYIVCVFYPTGKQVLLKK